MEKKEFAVIFCSFTPFDERNDKQFWCQKFSQNMIAFFATFQDVYGQTHVYSQLIQKIFIVRKNLVIALEKNTRAVHYFCYFCILVFTQSQPLLGNNRGGNWSNGLWNQKPQTFIHKPTP